MYKSLLFFLVSNWLFGTCPHILTNTFKEIVIEKNNIKIKDIEILSNGQYLMNDGCVINSKQLNNGNLGHSNDQIVSRIKSNQIYWGGKAIKAPLKIFNIRNEIIVNDMVICSVSSDHNSYLSPEGEAAFTYECIVWFTKTGDKGTVIEVGPINILNLYKIECNAKKQREKPPSTRNALD